MLLFLPVLAATPPDVPAAVMVVTGLCLLGVVALVKGRKGDRL